MVFSMDFEAIYNAFYAISIYLAVLHSSQLSASSFFHFSYRIVTIMVFAAGIPLWLLRCRKMSLRELRLTLVFTAVSCLSAYYSGRYLTVMMLVYLVVFGNRNDPAKLCKIYVASAVAGVVTVLFLTGIGVFYQEYRTRLDGTIRLYFGFHATTHLPNYLFHISLMYFFAKGTIDFFSTICVLSANLFAYMFTNTKAPFYEVILLIIMLWAIKLIKRKRLRRLVGVLAQYSMPILAAIFFYLSWTYNASDYRYFLLNRLLSDRLRVTRKVYDRYGIHLFGTETNWVTGRMVADRKQEYFSLDSAYGNIAVCYGIIILLILITGYVFVGKLYREQQNTCACCVLIILALHSFTDPQLIDYVYNPLLMLLFRGYFFQFHNRRGVFQNERSRKMPGRAAPDSAADSERIGSCV